MSESGRAVAVGALNLLLERARGGLAVFQACLRGTTDTEVRAAVRNVIVCHARVCSTLYQRIQELGGEASQGISALGGESVDFSRPGPAMEALATLLEDFITLGETSLAVLDSWSRDFLDEVLREQRRHLVSVRKEARGPRFGPSS